MVDVTIFPKEKSFEPILELYPPQLASKFIPQWYKEKNISKRFQVAERGLLYAKKCPAIKEILTTGIVIPAWTDIIFQKLPDGTVEWETMIGRNMSLPDDYPYIGNHSPEQIKGMELNGINNYGILKLTPPYYFKTPPGYGLEFQDLFYHFRKDIRFLPGLVETDKWHEVNFPFEFYDDINIPDEKVIRVLAGSPLFLIKPFKLKEKLSVNVKSYDSELNRLQNKNNILLNSYSGVWNEFKNNHKHKILEEE
tara:strand:+ start:1627 stop:2382 length:756 start_codon:yes stop_codon:yes gene_type:complete